MAWIRVIGLWLVLAAASCSEPTNPDSAPPPVPGAQTGTASPGGGTPQGTDAATTGDGGATGADAGPAPISDSPMASLVRMEDARRLTRPVVEQLLASPDVVLRRRTLLALGRVGDAEALGPLRSALTDSDAKTRHMALESLGLLRRPAQEDAEKVLRAFLELSPRPADRRVAITALGKVGSEAAVGPLLQALESPEPRLRIAAATALGNLAIREKGPGEQAMVALASHLDDSDPRVRLTSAFALSRCKGLTEAARANIGTALTKALRHDGDAEVRIMAGRALGALDAGGAGFLLAALEHDDDWRVRAAAATALGRRANVNQRRRGLKLAWGRVAGDTAKLSTADLHPLIALLTEAGARPAPQLKRQLLTIEQGAGQLLDAETDGARRLTLAHIQCTAALAQDQTAGRARRVNRCATTDPPLITDVERQVLVGQALAKSTVPGALNRLKVLLKHGDQRVRIVATEALGSTFTPMRLRMLERSLADDSPFVVATAAYKLGAARDHYHPKVVEKAQRLTITEHTAEGPVTHSLTEAATKGRDVPAKALTKALKRVNAENDVETVVNLLKAVGTLKAGDAAIETRRWAGHHNQTVRRTARKALEMLDRDPGPELRPDPPNLVDPGALARLAAGRPSVAVETTKGSFVIELRPDLAPGTVANFLSLAQKGYYNGVLFHRVVPGFVAQTGDPTATGYGGPGHTIRCEITNATYERGTVGMALAGPDTGGSQFFVTYSAQPHLDRRYTIFGRVTEGQGVVDSVQQWDRVVTIRRR